jgi:hypothetical protein
MRLKLPLCAAVTALCIATPSAHALSTCGSAGQPKCVEAPAPGVTLTLSAAENPKNLQPLATRPSADKPLWPKVNGHKPFGFNAVSWSHSSSGATIDDEAFLHEQMGATMARVGADWAMIQYYPNADAGGKPWDYEAYLDRQYRAHIRRGVRPLLMIARTPRRFTINAETQANSFAVTCGNSDACWNPVRDQDRKRLQTFATDLAKRYPLAAGIEFWNEPNAGGFWGGETPNPEQFTALLGTVHDAIKKVRPNWPIIAGGLSNSTIDHGSGTTQVLSLKNYLKRMLVAGAQSKMDAVSYHPYLGGYPHWTDDQAEIDRVLSISMQQSHKDAKGAYIETGKPILERFVMTEYGASTTNGYSEQKQHDWLVWQFHRWDIDDPEIRLSERTDAAFAHLAVENSWGYDTADGYGFVKSKNSDGAFIPKMVFCGYRKYFAPQLGECPTALVNNG